MADSSGVAVRAGPSTRAPRLARYDMGTLVHVEARLDFDGGWSPHLPTPPTPPPPNHGSAGVGSCDSRVAGPVGLVQELQGSRDSEVEVGGVAQRRCILPYPKMRKN